MYEETINRDSVITELLLDTQMGKGGITICKQKTSQRTQVFFDTLQEEFKAPDILLSYAQPINRNYASESLGGSRKHSRSSSKRRSSSKKRTGSRGYAVTASAKRVTAYDNEDVDFIKETTLSHEPKVFYEGEGTDEDFYGDEDHSIPDSHKIEPRLTDNYARRGRAQKAASRRSNSNTRTGRDKSSSRRTH